VVSSTIPQQTHVGDSDAEHAADSAEHAEGDKPASGDGHGDPAESSHAADKSHSEKSASRSASHDSVTGGGGAQLSTIFQLETFVVNINDGDRDRFLKIKPELEITEPAVADELKARMPQVKDIIISLLSSQSFSQIRSIEGKDALREDMMIRLNALVREGKVLRIFFTEFVVQ